MKKLATTFAGLCRAHELRPIHDDAAMDKATDVVMEMAGFPLNDDQEQYLEVLSGLIETYEQARSTLKAASMTPLEALRYLMEENGMNASQLGELLGQRQLGAKIVSGQRELSKSHIAILASRFAVSPALFLAVESKPTRARRSARQARPATKKNSHSFRTSTRVSSLQD